MESAEKLQVSKKSLEVTNEKLEAELEETKQRLRAALSRPAATGGADGKKSSVVARSAAFSTSGETESMCVCSASGSGGRAGPSQVPARVLCFS